MLPQSSHIKGILLKKTVGGPKDHGNLSLLIRGDRVREPMEINIVLAQGLAMIRDIEHCSGIFLIFQQIDKPTQDVIGVDDGVIVGIDDALAIAILHIVIFTFGKEQFEIFWGSLVVGWAMAPFLMKDDEHVPTVLGEQFIQIFQQNFVITFTR